MNEAARKHRNQQRLTECFPNFAQRMKAIINDLEAQGFRPLIQDAHRSLVKIRFAPTHIEATDSALRRRKVNKKTTKVSPRKARAFAYKYSASLPEPC